VGFDQITGLLREFGFPVFVASWFMFRLEKRIDRQSELLAALMQAMAIIAKSVEARGEYPRAATGRVALIPGDKEQP